MNTVLICLGGIFMGNILPRFAGRIAKIVQSLGGQLAQALINVEDWAEARTGVHLPDWAKQVYCQAVAKGVAFAEGIFGTQEFWNQFLFILRGQPSQIGQRLLDMMSKIDWSKGLDQVLPEELKQVINEAKQASAVKQVKASIAHLPAEHQPSDEKIINDIKLVAPAAGKSIGEPAPEVKHDDILAKIAETKAKLLAMSDK